MRTTRTDSQWQAIAPHCPGRACDPGLTGPICRGGSPDRLNGLPVARPSGSIRETEYCLHRLPPPGEGGCFLSRGQCVGRGHRFGTYGYRRHDRQGSPLRMGRKRGPQCQAIGRSRGGMKSKILARADAGGSLINFRLRSDRAHDLRGTADLIGGLTCRNRLADRVFDANWLCGTLRCENRSRHPAKIQAPFPRRV